MTNRSFQKLVLVGGAIGRERGAEQCEADTPSFKRRSFAKEEEGDVYIFQIVSKLNGIPRFFGVIAYHLTHSFALIYRRLEQPC